MIHRPHSALILIALLVAACGSTSQESGAAGGGSGAPPGTAGGSGAVATGGAAGGSAPVVAGSSSGGSSGSATEGGANAGIAGATAAIAGATAAGAAGASVGGGSSGGGSNPPAGDPGTVGDGNFVAGPTYALADDLRAKGNPQGRSFTFTMQSSASKIFTGLDTTLIAPKAFSRSVTVYVPAQYKAGTAAPLMVIQDGGGTPFVLIKAALDNLTIETNPARRLPAFVAIAVANGGSDSKGSQRGLEYDTMSDRYARFIDSEVLPAAEGLAQLQAAYPGFTFTKNPEGRGAVGCSSGAAAAFTMAWFRPDLFRRVIAYSTTLVDQQDDDAAEEAMYPLGAWDYHSGLGLIANGTPNKAVRMMINANSMDNGYNAAESGHHNWLMANERTAAAFKAKGYHYRYVLGQGLGHCDQKVQQATMAESLLWVWRGYQNTP